MDNLSDRLSLGSARLQKRLYEIETHRLNVENEFRGQYIPNHAIDDLSSAIFKEGDYETVQDHLNFLLDNFKKVREKLSFHLRKYNYESITINTEEEWPNLVISAKEIKSTLRKKLKHELSYYIKSIERLNLTMQEKLKELGTNQFSNAGFKISFDLTVEELGCLFNCLYESGVISKKTNTEKVLNKKLLADFISKNFNCRTKVDISPNSIENALSFKNPSAISKVEEWFDKFSNILPDSGREMK